MAVLRRFDVSIIQVTIMSTINRQLCLKHRPEGLVRREDFDLVRQPLGELNDGEVLVRVSYISMDPTNPCGCATFRSTCRPSHWRSDACGRHWPRRQVAVVAVQ
jgi:NADPH-dependent curcumin reductase CurA